MKHALKILPDGTGVTVTADGKGLHRRDVTQRVLHILPKLFVPAEALSGLLSGEIDLTISTTLGVDLNPPGEIVVRQPYPNRCYFIGGSHDIRNGWVIPIPDNVAAFDIEFRWEIFRPWRVPGLDAADEWEIRHLVHVTLQPGNGNTFTMDACC